MNAHGLHVPRQWPAEPVVGNSAEPSASSAEELTILGVSAAAAMEARRAGAAGGGGGGTVATKNGAANEGGGAISGGGGGVRGSATCAAPSRFGGKAGGGGGTPRRCCCCCSGTPSDVFRSSSSIAARHTDAASAPQPWGLGWRPGGPRNASSTMHGGKMIPLHKPGGGRTGEDVRSTKAFSKPGGRARPFGAGTCSQGSSASAAAAAKPWRRARRACSA
mmetsp:Transcript_96296/g.241394  ORF Transcript_96296/g.241394 Transcript_96296/m.241394 type:complete len:220 (-) Transcript_96296:500-1159(-)